MEGPPPVEDRRVLGVQVAAHPLEAVDSVLKEKFQTLVSKARQAAAIVSVDSEVRHLRACAAFTLFLERELVGNGYQSLEEAMMDLGGGEGGRGVCGVVWGPNNIAYKCKTCEHDPTCAICVACFLGGDHAGHDYSMIRTGGGCCDCGDPTAWKAEGVCKRHRGGSGAGVSLPDAFVERAERVVKVMVKLWVDGLQDVLLGGGWGGGTMEDVLCTIPHFLVEVAGACEELLRVVGGVLGDSEERFLEEIVGRYMRLSPKLTAGCDVVLYKLLGEPGFKKTFALTLLRQYSEGVMQRREERGRWKKTCLESFSVQIFTVPTLTPLLVKEEGLLEILLANLSHVFLQAAGPEGNLRIPTLAAQNFHNRVLDDLRYVLTHPACARHAVITHPVLARAWVYLVSATQGMGAQIRLTANHVEEEGEEWSQAYFLGQSMGAINPLLVAACVQGGGGRVWSEGEGWSDEGGGKRMKSEGERKALSDLIAEAVAVLGTWLTLDGEWEGGATKRSAALWMQGPDLGRGENLLPTADGPQPESGGQGAVGEGLQSQKGLGRWIAQEVGVVAGGVGGGTAPSVWADQCPRTHYDVAKQEVSFHLPLHRLLALLLSTALQEDVPPGNTAGKWASSDAKEGERRACEQGLAVLLDRDLGSEGGGGRRWDPKGGAAALLELFSPRFRGLRFFSCLLEHPLRLSVACAQIKVGMWRRNGQSMAWLAEAYHSVQWCEDSLDLDVFLMQLCAVLVPPDHFVVRVMERFGLPEFFIPVREQSKKYDSSLACQALRFLIRIVSERSLCGLSSEAALRREVVNRLAAGDATHSAILRSLPSRLAAHPAVGKVVDQVASFRTPSEMQQGKYVLRPQCWAELDLYHPRWAPRDLQRAELRYQEATQQAAVVHQRPRWSDPIGPFQSLAAIATSAAVHDIVAMVLGRTLWETAGSGGRRGGVEGGGVPLGLIHVALHLLALGLDCWEVQVAGQDSLPGGSMGASIRHRYWNPSSLLSILMGLVQLWDEGSMRDLGGLAKQLLVRIGALDGDFRSHIEMKLPQLQGGGGRGGEDATIQTDGEAQRMAARARQAAAMEKMKAAQAQFAASLGGEGEAEEAAEVEELQCALCREAGGGSSPLCYITLGQRSMIVSAANAPCPRWDKPRAPPASGDDRPPPPRNIETEEGGGMVDTQDLLRWIEQHEVEGADGEQAVELVRETLVAMGRRPVRGTVVREWRGTGGDREVVHEFHIGGEVVEEREGDGGKGEGEEGGDGEEVGVREGGRESGFASNEMAEGMTEEERREALDGEAVFDVLSAYVTAVRQAPREAEGRGEEGAADVGRETAGAAGPPGVGSVQVVRQRVGRSTAWDKRREGPGGAGRVGLHVLGCGHAVHRDCLDRYFSSLLQRYLGRVPFEGGHLLDPERGEFLCPMCRRLANAILPLLPPRPRPLATCPPPSDPTFAAGLDLPRLALLRGRESPVAPAEGPVGGTLDAFSSRLSDVVKGVGVDETPAGVEQKGLLMWQALSYTAASAELSARLGVRGDLCQRLVVLGACVKRGGVLRPLAEAALLARTHTEVAVLGRLRGLQMLVGAVVWGVGREGVRRRRQEGALTPAEVAVAAYLDQQARSDAHRFFTRAAEPVLASTSFALLASELYCLPGLPTAHELCSLVHVAYAVCVTQALAVAFHAGVGGEGELPLSVQTLIEFIGRSTANPVGPAGSAAATERVLGGLERWVKLRTLPFLRRCALLQHVLLADVAPLTQEGAASAERLDVTVGKRVDVRVGGGEPVGEVPPGGGSSMGAEGGEGMPSQGGEEKAEKFRGMCGAEGGPVQSEAWEREEGDLREVEVWERWFHIAPLGVFLEDKLVNACVMRWCRHLSRGAVAVAVPGGGAPFSLLTLPHSYHDLFQRYIGEKCCHCQVAAESPALCLLCGALCCMSGREARVGARMRPTGTCWEAYFHSKKCGEGVGVFLLLKKSTMALMRMDRCASWPSLYLDAYGEEDENLRRGKPLFLSRERLDALTALGTWSDIWQGGVQVASQGLDHNSSVLARTVRWPHE